jgi:hypothetical protein
MRKQHVLKHLPISKAKNVEAEVLKAVIMEADATQCSLGKVQ